MGALTVHLPVYKSSRMDTYHKEYATTRIELDKKESSKYAEWADWILACQYLLHATLSTDSIVLHIIVEWEYRDRFQVWVNHCHPYRVGAKWPHPYKVQKVKNNINLMNYLSNKDDTACFWKIPKTMSVDMQRAFMDPLHRS